MAKQAALKKPAQAFKSSTQARSGRVFAISLKGIPRIDAAAQARLEAAARSPQQPRRDYPHLAIE